MLKDLGLDRNDIFIIVACIVGVIVAIVGVYYFYVALLWATAKAIGYVLGAFFGNFVDAYRAIAHH
jgi:hypothetical protein